MKREMTMPIRRCGKSAMMDEVCNEAEARGMTVLRVRMPAVPDGNGSQARRRAEKQWRMR